MSLPVTVTNQSSSAFQEQALRFENARKLLIPVVQFWKGFDLDSKRLIFDQQGFEIQTSKESSVQARKYLAEMTKGFVRQAVVESVLDAPLHAALGHLLKTYQEEIDALTKRAKFAEVSFFNLYKALSEAPDPAPILETMLEYVPPPSTSLPSQRPGVDLEVQVRKLKEQLEQYEQEFKNVQNQDITIRELKERLATFEDDVALKAENLAFEKVQHVASVKEEQIQNLQELYDDAQRTLKQTQRDLQASHSKMDQLQSQLLELQQSNTESRMAHHDELTYVAQTSQEIESLRLRNAELQRQLDEVKEEISKRDDDSRVYERRYSRDALLSAELNVKTLNDTIVSLRGELLSKESIIQSLQLKVEEEIKRRQLENDEKDVALELLRHELASLPSPDEYASVLKKLRVFQQLEYNGTDVVEEESAEDATEMEKVLLGRVRRLELELRQHLVAYEENVAMLEKQSGTLDEVKRQLAEKSALAKKLEEDLANGMHQIVSGTSSQGQLLMNVLDVPRKQPIYDDNSVQSDAYGPEAMLQIVSSQRDRFRERIKELQAEKDSEVHKITSMKSAMKRLEDDNVQLYQKIRYLQSYNGGSARFPPKASQLEEGIPLEPGVEHKYRSIYDQKMNPFEQFNRNEQEQRYGNLNTVDKILLTSGKMILGHPITRNFAFTYAVLLHFLVFATLYTYMHGCGISNT